MAKTIKLSCVSYYKHNYTLPSIGWDKPVYINYEGGLRAMRLKRMDVEVVNFPDGHTPVPSARWTMEVAGLGEVVLLNGCLSFPIKMYLSPEDYEAECIADPCNCNYGRLWNLYEWVAECFHLEPEELGTAYRKSVHDGSAIAILRYRWTGTMVESVPVEIPTTAYYDRTGWHFSEPCSLMSGTYPSVDECKRCSSLNVVEFGDEDEHEEERDAEVEDLAERYNALTCAQKDEFLRMTGNE